MNGQPLAPAPAHLRFIVAPAPRADITCQSCDKRDAVHVVAFADGGAFYTCAPCTP